MNQGDYQVVKFGGTSVGTGARVAKAARRVRAHVRRGRRVVAVVSAAGGTTDRLLRRAAALGGTMASPAAREVDRALATGEDRSATLLAVALWGLGIPARSLTGQQAGLLATGPHGRGRIVDVAVAPLQALLDDGVVAVVSGFQASRPDGETVTLGRGGSDVTAVTLAAALDAPCDIVTDVAGVYDRDPRLHPEAELLPALDHSELVRLVERGARVVHPVAARVAEERRVPLRVYHYKASPRCTGGTLVGVAACGDRSIGASGDGARAASDASGGSDASVVAAEAPAREARAAVGGGS